MDKYLIEAQSLARNGSFADAADLCRKAIKRGKDVALAKKILANCLCDLGTMQGLYGGRLEDAKFHFNAALAVNPNHVNALNSLGACLQFENLAEEAIALYRRALKIEPSNVPVLENLAKTQQHAGKLTDASASLRKLAALVPANAAAYLLREALLIHKVVPDSEYPVQIRESIIEKLAALETGNARMNAPLRFSSTYFPLSYHGINNRDLLKRIASLHLKAAPKLAWTAPHIASWQGPAKRIKIGIASHFFRAHSIGQTSRGLVQHLDRKLFEVVLVKLGSSKPDATSELIEKSADSVITVPYDNLQAARNAISALSLDILFYQDIGMEPMSYLLAFSRLAPVQCTSFGHPDTTGIPNMDYFISSAHYEMDDADEHYSERLVRLPDAGTLAYYYRPPQASARTRESFGLSTEERIYLCPQSLFKIQPDMDGIFRSILEKDASARIVLIAPGDEDLRPALEQRFSTSLAGLLDRVSFIPALPYEDYLGLLKCADVILDTLHFNGQNTSLESFAMGIPVITLPGRMQRERHTYGMYKAMNFTDLVAGTEKDYVELALRVANNAAFRSLCQARIAASCGVLFENREFVRHCEKALQAMLAERLPSPPMVK
ncbi:tetratricopeptide repeat protein [Undibacterium sp. TJN25]|uniref:O-linked N-acetylglucosamine transferase, SPINDLY family protein n=1 Tax=Undibacterium sp. TJN25 TaxID=3413056 RepID=UPI003BF1853C